MGRFELFLIAALLLVYLGNIPRPRETMSSAGILADRSVQYFGATPRPNLPTFREQVLNGALPRGQSPVAVYYGAKVMHARGALTAKNFEVLLRD